MNLVKKTDTYELLTNEAERLRVVIFLTPVPKGRPRFGRGIVYTPTKTKRFEAQLKKIIREIRIAIPLMQGALGLTVDFYSKWPSKKTPRILYKSTRPDLDNLIKAVADSMNGIVYKDDAQIAALQAYKFYVSDDMRPRIHIDVRKFHDPMENVEQVLRQKVRTYP